MVEEKKVLKDELERLRKRVAEMEKRTEDLEKIVGRQAYFRWKVSRRMRIRLAFTLGFQMMKRLKR